MINLVDLFRVFKSLEFLEKYETNEERNKAVKELQSNGISFFCRSFGYLLLACLSVVLIKLI